VRRKGKRDFGTRAPELLNLTIADPRNNGRLRELTRVREALADHIAFDNEYHTTELSRQKFFHASTHALRVRRGAK
jgi:hypothetical protein